MEHFWETVAITKNLITKITTILVLLRHHTSSLQFLTTRKLAGEVPMAKWSRLPRTVAFRTPAGWNSRRRRRVKTSRPWTLNSRTEITGRSIHCQVHSFYLWKFFIDPRGRPTVTAGSDHCFHTWCLYVRPSPLFKMSQNKTKQISSENSDRYWRDCGSVHVDHWWHTSCHHYSWKFVLWLGIWAFLLVIYCFFHFLLLVFSSRQRLPKNTNFKIRTSKKPQHFKPKYSQTFSF